MNNLKTLKLIATIAIGAIAASSATAAPLNGDIQFTGSGTLNNTRPADATQITNFTATTQLSGSTGDYAAISNGTSVTIKDLDFNSVGYVGNLAITDFWSVTSGGVTYSFDLERITTNTVVGEAIVIQGRGTAKTTGTQDDFGGTFQLSTSGGSTSITFSSTTSVPDSGHTAALLGLSMLGLAGLARRLRK